MESEGLGWASGDGQVLDRCGEGAWNSGWEKS